MTQQETAVPTLKVPPTPEEIESGKVFAKKAGYGVAIASVALATMTIWGQMLSNGFHMPKNNETPNGTEQVANYQNNTSMLSVKNKAVSVDHAVLTP